MAKEKGATPETPEEPKAPKTKPRDYTVCRETTGRGLREGKLDIDDDARVLIVLGPAKARTPKEARVTVAKTSVPEADLVGDGVELNAVPAKALESGRKVVRVETRQAWDG